MGTNHYSSRRFAGLPLGFSLLPLSALVALLLSPAAQSASNVRVRVDGRTLTLASTGETVREALQEARVTLDADDEVSPSLETLVPSGGVIRVTRVTFREGTTEEKIPYRTVVRPATRGNRPYHPTIVSRGKVGLKRTTYRVKVVDGQETERVALGTEVVRQPVNQVVIARNPGALGSRGLYSGAKTVTVLASAYDPGPGSCGKYANGRTCNGKRAGYGIIAVDPKVFPLGAKLFVPGYGYGIAADVGSAIKGNRVDLGYNSRSGAMKWGKKWVRVTIVD